MSMVPFKVALSRKRHLSRLVIYAFPAKRYITRGNATHSARSFIGRSDYADFQLAVGIPAVAAAVTALEFFVITVARVFVREIARLFQIGEHMITFGVDIGRDVVRNLARCMA